MSHTTFINSVPVRSVTALEQAVAELTKQGINCTLARNAKPRMYYREQENKCDYVLKLPDAQFDVGFKKNSDNSYTAFTDFHAGSVNRLLGVKYSPLAGEDLESAKRLVSAGEAKSLREIEDGRAKAAQMGKLLQEYSKAAVIEQVAKEGMQIVRLDQMADGSWQVEAQKLQML